MEYRARIQTTGYISCLPDVKVYDQPHVFADIRVGTGHYISSEQPEYFDELARTAMAAAEGIRAKHAELAQTP